MLLKIAMVFIGGGLGSVLRFACSSVLYRWAGGWPLGTWFVNLVGSFLIGLFAGYLMSGDSGNYWYRLLLITGFCGGFTTFSAFSFENIQLVQEGMFLKFFLYAVSSVSLGLLFVFLGLKISQ
ncbi:fluoride efflux transporter CrcB [Membranihabitans maritimus]|uniref:fluoride efflux transporter CrcB n=1 Tax=Membranihabitans maritimus TaxID=2904244 RepID=UPI001F00393C|nr:fluoride efflux transporter CrcB [Membranihabitans maritimus]